MGLKRRHRSAGAMDEFDSSVILYGTETRDLFRGHPFAFDSSVILYGTENV